MAKILHLKTREVEVDYFHFYGCSLPAGHELTDPWSKDNKLEGRELFEAQKKNKELSFPAKVAELFDVPFSNRAEYGCSIGTTKFYLIEDVLRHKIKRNQAIFFCITHQKRIHGFDENNGRALSWQLHEAAERFGKQDFLTYQNDFKLLYEYFVNLWEVILIAKTTGCPLFFVPMFAHSTFNNMQSYDTADPELPFNKIDVEWNLMRQIRNIIREIEAYTINIKPMMRYTCDVAEERGLDASALKNPGGHPMQEIHDLYAKDIFKLLKNDK